MTETEINDAYKAAWADAIATYGDKYSVPSDVMSAMAEEHRQNWVKFVAERDGKVGPVVKHDKTDKLNQFCSLAPVGMEINVTFLAGAADCSEGTAQKFINDHRSLFRAVPDKRGAYVIIDAEAERAAAKQAAAVPRIAAGAPEPVLPIVRASDAPAVPAAPRDVRIPPP